MLYENITYKFVEEENINWNSSVNSTKHDNIEWYNWPMLSLCSVILLSILGNTLVCLAIVKNKKLQNVTNYFLFSLAIADLMVAMLVMPFGVVNNVTGYWSMGLVLCDIWVSLDVLCCTSSILHMCCLFVDRYLAIQNPLKYSLKRKTLRQTVTKITSLWILSIMISLPLFIVGLLNPEKVLHDGICAPMTKEFVFYGSVFAFFIPLLIVIVTYSLTTLILHKKSKSVEKSDKSKKRRFRTLQRKHIVEKMQNKFRCKQKVNNNSIKKTFQTHESIEMKTLIESTNLNQMQECFHEPNFLRKNSKHYNEKRAEKVLGIIFVSFVIGWLPFFTTNIINAMCSQCISNNSLFISFEWLGWSSSLVNPIIYTIFSKDFQKAFCKLLSVGGLCQKKITTSKGFENYLTNLKYKINQSQETHV
ncbi:D(3) dopamine receptor-like [Antedon mediterranea]|uniref:D(3) dopamine receptor-like n=1 Tax=Antedon mediterranea TaxID=105859 RepID=UPI003AF73A24